MVKEIEEQLRAVQGASPAVVIPGIAAGILACIALAIAIPWMIISDRGPWWVGVIFSAVIAVIAIPSFWIGIRQARRHFAKRRVCQEGTLSFVHVGHANKWVTQESNSVFYELNVTLLHPSGQQRVVINVDRDVPPMAGVYPALTHPDHPEQTQVKL